MALAGTAAAWSPRGLARERKLGVALVGLGHYSRDLLAPALQLTRHCRLAGLVTGSIERWDAAETSSQLELLLGRDLQFIRINGTVVGASVGLILHAVVLALG